MGANIARRLKDCGYEITSVIDRDADAAQAVAEELGASAATKPSEVTASADVIFTVVTDDTAMREIFDPTAPESLLHDAAGKLFINCATITPGVHVEIEAHAKQAGAETLEAPMASSITQAREGTLYMMLGGSRETFERALPILENITASRKFIGPTGSASQMKALVNMVMNINTAALAEGLGIADALGLDLDVVREVFSQTGANSRVLETDGPDMVARDHETFFSAAHAAKDSGIALALAEDCGIQAPLAAATKGQFDRLVEVGCGEMDKSAVAELTFKGRRA